MGKAAQTAGKQVKQGKGMFLDKLEEGSNGPITVMVCQKWDVNNINGRYMSTNFIVSDKKGNVIAKNNIAHYFNDKLHEGRMYSLRNLTVRPNRDGYRIMKNAAYIIDLQGSTIVSKPTESIDGFVRHPFDLVAYEDLEPTDGKYFVGTLPTFQT